MAVAVPQIVVIKNHAGVDQTYSSGHTNPNADRTWGEHLVKAEEKTSIAFRTLQGLQKVIYAAATVLKEMGDAMYAFFEKLSGKLLTAWTWLIVSRLPAATQDGMKAISEWGTVEGPEGYSGRGHIQRVHNLADFGATWLYFLSLFFNSTPAKDMADMCCLGADATDAAMAREDMQMADHHLQQIESTKMDALKQRFQETKTEAFWRLAKAVASVVSGVLGLLTLTYGMVFSAPILIPLGLATTTLALVAYFYKENMTYKPVKFFEWIDKGASVTGGIN